jgi:hypothetical protein
MLSWFIVIQKIFRVSQNAHVIYSTTHVNNFTIFLLSLFYCRQNLCQVNRQFFRWVRTIRSLVQGRIHKLKNVLIVDLGLYLKTKKLLSVFPLFMTNMLSFLRTRLPTLRILVYFSLLSTFWYYLQQHS